jgi:hypothetical protein
MNVLRMIETFHEHKIKEQDMTNQENPFPQGVLTKVGRYRKDGTYSPGKEMWVKGPVGPVQS